LVSLCLIIRQRHNGTYRHLNRLVNRTRNNEPLDVIYDHANDILQTTARATKV
jgi:hypothetical protein